MRLDAHHHLWTYKAAAFVWIEPGSAIARDFTTQALVEALDEQSISAAIAVQARQSDEETAFLLDAARNCRRIVGVVGWIDLRHPDIDQRLAAAADPLLVGYRHVVQDEADADFLRDPAIVRGVQAVAGRSLSYDILVNHLQLPTVPKFIEAVGHGRFILDHAAKPRVASGDWLPWANDIAAVARLQNVYCKVSGLVTEASRDTWQPADFERYLVHIFEQFGPDRIMWGSDWPVCLLAAPYGATYSLIEDFVSRHCPHAAPAIFGENAIKAYSLQARLS
jgi:L-fuconolactonase